MAYTSWRGVVGCVKPTMRPGGIEELIRILPDGVCLLPLFLDIRKGSVDEFKRAVEPYEPLIARLAEAKVDLIHPEGAPPFMLLGYDGEAALLDKWEQKFGLAMFTSGTNHVRALRALGVKKFVGATYFEGPINDMFSSYFRQAGFDVLGMEGLAVPFQDVGQLSPYEVYAHVKRAFLRHEGAEGVYLLGSGWRVMEVLQALEDDLRVPVVHPITARSWEIQRRLEICQPVSGYGRLLEEMPIDDRWRHGLKG
jgi:maleate isomerase